MTRGGCFGTWAAPVGLLVGGMVTRRLAKPSAFEQLHRADSWQGLTGFLVVDIRPASLLMRFPEAMRTCSTIRRDVSQQPSRCGAR